ncbi:MAG: hypothetical protein Fur0020_10100 [Thermodesulfovibrionia bacterium]
MRYLKLFIVGLILLYLLYKLLALYPTLIGRGGGYFYREMIAESETSISYVLNTEKWLTFPFEIRGGIIRILTNANLPRNINLKDGEWGYAIRYQITGKGGDILMDKTYNLRSKVTFYKDDRWGEYTSSFYTDTGIIPADSRGFRLNISNLEDARAIRFILVKKDSDIRDVSMRLYIRYEPERIAGYMWRRLSDKKKERMAMGNVYPPELLTDHEKIELLKNQWRPLGPLGAEGKEFEIRKLYVLKEVEGEEVGLYIPPLGIPIKNGHHATIPVPEGGRLRIEFYNDSDTIPHDIRLFWYGKEIGEFFEKRVRWNEPRRTSIESHFDTGLIDIYVEEEISFRAFLIKDKEEEITQKPLYMRTYIISKDKPITFRIAHHGNSPTPFKASLRLILGEGIRLNSYVTYELLGEGDNVIYRGRLTLNPMPSLYDTLTGEDLEVSDPAEYYFYLPVDVRFIRFYSDTDVMVSGYTRPDDMVRTVNVPQDYLLSTPLEEKEPSWFAIRPEGHWSLIYERRSPILLINIRPPERREELIEGIYEWEDYIPEGDYEGHYILTEEIKDVKPNRESPYYYFPLRSDAENTISIREIKGLNTLSPTLIYVLKDSKEAHINVYVDDRQVLNTRVYNSVGEIRLLPIRIGTHRIRIESSSKGEFYINNIKYEGGKVIFKRFTSAIKDRGLSFIYNKESPDETLSVRFYAPRGSNKPSIIDVNIEAKRMPGLIPSNEWTFLKRRFVINADDSSSIPILYTQDGYLQTGQLFFIPIGEDMPEGVYRITFKPVSGRGYISLHRVTPGEYERMMFYNERALNYEDIQ